MDKTFLHEVRILHQLGISTATAESLEVVLEASADAVARLLPCRRVSLIELDTAARRVGFFAAGGEGRNRIVKTVAYAELERGLSGWVLRNRVPAVSPQGTPDDREEPDVQRRRAETECGSIVVVPLRYQDQVLGTMTAINDAGDPDFTPDQVELMEVFADYCAIVIQNGRYLLDLKNALQEVARRNRLKDNLFAILAHDLRGPIGSTATLFEYLAGQAGLDQDSQMMLSTGGKAVRQAYNLVENLLGWVRCQLEGVRELQSTITVADLLDHVVQAIEPSAMAKGIRVFRDCPGYLSLTTEVASVETILRNFASNAVKFSPRNSQVLVRARDDQNLGLVIEVEDFGAGMDAEQVARLFGRTKVESQPGTEGERGNGLGLMFCADLAASVGSFPSVDSVPGRGSTFRLTFPRADLAPVI